MSGQDEHQSSYINSRSGVNSNLMSEENIFRFHLSPNSHKNHLKENKHKNNYKTLSTKGVSKESIKVAF